MQTISINELQLNLNLYLNKVKDGDEIVIEDENEVIARISPFNTEDEKLVSQGLMTMPENSLPEDFWEADVPELPLEKIVETIRSERDED